MSHLYHTYASYPGSPILPLQLSTPDPSLRKPSPHTARGMRALRTQKADADADAGPWTAAIVPC